MYDIGAADGFVGEAGQQFAEPEYLGEPQSGTFAEGDGVSTSQLSNPNVDLADHKRVASGPWWQQSPGLALAIVLLLVIFRAVFQKLRDRNDIMVGTLSFEHWALGGLSVAVFLYFARTGSQLLPNGGLAGAVKQFFGAV